MPYNAVVTVSSIACQQGEVAVVENVTIDANGTMVARIASDPVNWYDNSHGGFGTRDNLLFARTCFNEYSARGGAAQNLYIIAQCLSQGGCTVQHRESFRCEKWTPGSNCSCVGCTNHTSLRGTQDQEVLASITCPTATDEVVVVKMNAASKPNNIFNLLVQQDPDSSNYFPQVSILSATCGLVSNFKLPRVNSASVVARCAAQACEIDWAVTLRCESSLLPFSCPCENCDKTLSLKQGETKTLTTTCPAEVGISALRFVTRNQGFRLTSNSVALASPAGRSSVCFYSPKGILWTGQQRLDAKLECLDAGGCDFNYQLVSVCECACVDCNASVTLTRGQSRTWGPQSCGVGEKPVLKTLQASSADGQFLVSVLGVNQSLVDSLPPLSRGGCYDAYLTKPLAVNVNSTIEVKCLTAQCSLRNNIAFACQPANTYVIAMANSTQCLSSAGSSLSLAPCDVSSPAQRFSFSLANPKAGGADTKSFFLNKVVVLRSSAGGCVTPQARLQPSCPPAAKLRVSGQSDKAFTLRGRGKAGGCLIGQNSNVVRSSACNGNSAWSVFAVVPST